MMTPTWTKRKVARAKQKAKAKQARRNMTKESLVIGGQLWQQSNLRAIMATNIEKKISNAIMAPKFKTLQTISWHHKLKTN